MLWNQRLASRLRFRKVLLVDHCRTIHLDSTRASVLVFISMNTSHLRVGRRRPQRAPLPTLRFFWFLSYSYFIFYIACSPLFHWLNPILIVILIVWRYQMLLATVERRGTRARTSTNTSYMKSISTCTCVLALRGTIGWCFSCTQSTNSLYLFHFLFTLLLTSNWATILPVHFHFIN